MQKAESASLEGAAQLVIENFLNRLADMGVSMRLLQGADSYMRAADAIGCWVDPACAQESGSHNAALFWVEFFDAMRVPVALASGMKWQTDDIMPDISKGHLWYPGGFADHCALHHIDLAEPQRLVSGSISYLQLSLSSLAEPPPPVVANMSLLIQALAMRHHKPDWIVQLGIHAKEINASPRLTECFKSDDFLACTYFPPAETVATLNLHYSDPNDFLEMAGIQSENVQSLREHQVEA